MESDWLAERDRARRLRKQRQAKTQLIVLGIFVLLGLALVGVRYQTQDHLEAAPIQKVEEPQSEINEASNSEEPTSSPVGTRTDVQPTLASPPAVPDPKPVRSLKIETDIGTNPPTEKECFAVLKAFLAAPDVGARSKFVIEKAGLLERMKEYYESRHERDPEIGNPISSGNLNMGIQVFTSLTFQSRNSPTSIGRASFLRAADGTTRLDWESFVGWTAVPWQTLMETKKSEETVLRAYVSKDDYHNYEFTDTQKFSSYRLRNADGSLAINGFVELGGPAALALLSRFDEAEAAARSQSVGPDKVWLPLTIKVRFPPQASSDHCVHLTEVVENRWLLPQEPQH